MAAQSLPSPKVSPDSRSSPPPSSQFVYPLAVPSDHTQEPSTRASLLPIQAILPWPSVVEANEFSAELWMLARSPP